MKLKKLMKKIGHDVRALREDLVCTGLTDQTLWCVVAHYTIEKKKENRTMVAFVKGPFPSEERAMEWRDEYQTVAQGAKGPTLTYTISIMDTGSEVFQHEDPEDGHPRLREPEREVARS